jgi:hypothetical protein
MESFKIKINGIYLVYLYVTTLITIFYTICKVKTEFDFNNQISKGTPEFGLLMQFWHCLLAASYLRLPYPWAALMRYSATELPSAPLTHNLKILL